MKPLAIVTPVYLLWYALFLFAPGLVRMDDFGYLQSVGESLVQGRILTHDWLAPYNVPLTALSSLAFIVSGNFHLSTWGLLAVFSLANFFLLYLLLRSRLDAWTSSLGALAISTFPIYAHKTSEYAGHVPALFFMLGALLAYRYGRWGVFFACAFLAFATRQNQFALLALPALWLLQPVGENHRRMPPLIGLGFFAFAAPLLHFLTNRTFSQTQDMYAHAGWRQVVSILETFVIGMMVVTLVLAICRLSFSEKASEEVSKPRHATFKRLGMALGLLLSATGLCLMLMRPFPFISFLTPLVGSLDGRWMLQWALAVAMLAALPFAPRLWNFPMPYWTTLTGFIAISSLRGFWYDFYFLEFFLLALFAYLQNRQVLHFSFTGKLMLGLVLAVNLAWAYGYKIHCDKQRLSAEAYERLERAGSVQVSEMTDGSFGFLGWKLFDHYRDNPGPGRASDFQCYVQRDRVVVESEIPWRRSFKRDLSDGEVVLDRGEAPVGFFTLGYRVVRLHASDASSLCGNRPISLENSGYTPKPFPLNASEWKAYGLGQFQP